MNVPEAPFVLHLSNVMHLATDVAGVLVDDTSSLALVESLHPSAAVCGTPTSEADAVIAELEHMDRGRYAGPVGWIDATGDGEWGIALRCGAVSTGGPVTDPALRRLRHRRGVRPRGGGRRVVGQVRADARRAGRPRPDPLRAASTSGAEVR